MNNTEHGSQPIKNEQSGMPLHKTELVNKNNELNFELIFARQQLTRILTAAKVSTVDEVVQMLERHQLSDEDIERAAKSHSDDRDSQMSFIVGANFAKQHHKLGK